MVDGMDPFFRRSGVRAFALLVALAALLAATNPSEARHHAAIHKETKRAHPVVGGLLGPVTTYLLTYDSYIVCSTTSLEGKVRSVGFLGMVFVQGD